MRSRSASSAPPRTAEPVSRAALPWVSARSAATETQCKIAAPFTVAAVGDVISPQPLKRSEPRFTALIDRIRAADLGFANMESSLIPAGFPHAIAGTAAPLAMGEALRWG